MVPLVRVGENNPNLIKRVMDAGAYGDCSYVNSAGEAQRAVDSVKYRLTARGVGYAPNATANLRLTKSGWPKKVWSSFKLNISMP